MVMPVLLVHNRYQNRGGEDIVFEAERALLERKGHRVEVYERHNDEIREFGLTERILLAGRTVRAKDSALALREILRTRRPEVAVFYNTFPLISPAVFSECVEAKVPAIQVLPNYRLICPGAQHLRSGRVCERCVGKSVPWPGVVHGCYRKSRSASAVVAAMLTYHRLTGTWKHRVDTYIVLTEFMREKMVAGGLPAEKIVVKPNFLDPDPGPRSTESDYALFVGRLSREKGIQTLLNAWESLTDIPLKIVGDGPLKPIVEQTLADRTGSPIELLGWLDRDEVLDRLRKARFLVVPSEWYEGFPLTMVEALACGVPIVGSRIGGVGEIVADGTSGLLFEPGNVADLIEKVKSMWFDDTLRAERGRNARSQFENGFTAEKNYQLLMEIFERCTNHNR